MKWMTRFWPVPVLAIALFADQVPYLKDLLWLRFSLTLTVAVYLMLTIGKALSKGYRDAN